MSRHKPRRRHDDGGGENLMLAAMVDMMMTLLIFLLHLYGSGGVEVPDGLQLASSTATTPAAPAVTVAVTPEGVSLRGVVVVAGNGNALAPWQAAADGTIPELRAALENEADRLASRAPPATPAEAEEAVPELLVQIDKRIPWTALQPVLRSAASAGFVKVRFLVSSVGER